ncbi:MAG: Fe-S protein assembly chaperone HscA, partial [Planctomycetia bacterium]|nr:Fe-S protein assembly chaperone HscA [Planctomycetia bacterium]
QLAEQRVEADRAISALESALAIDGGKYLDKSEHKALLDCMQSLEEIKEKGDADTIKQTINKLNELSEPFAARRMNASIQDAMAGHNINEFSE